MTTRPVPTGSVFSPRVLADRVLRAPVSRRAWAELAYVLLGAPLALLGVAYVLICFLLGAGLAITAVGIPILAVAVPAARGFGRARRYHARALLGETIATPAPFAAGRGVLTFLRAGLRDTTGWRAIAYLVAAFALLVLGLAVVTVIWAWGLLALTYPIQHLLKVNQMTAQGADGVTRHGLVIGGAMFDTGPRLLAVSVAGAALILVAPWAVRGVVFLDLLLVRALLAPDATSVRIADLRRTRSHAVDDAAATLRRIERDLHDGVQARLVALGMNLTMIAETLDPNASAVTRELLDTARVNTKTAIGDLRDVVSGIHPPVLDTGLDAALATLAALNPIPVSIRTVITDRPSAAIETIAYFCVAELLTNITKHSEAGNASVETVQRDGRVRLRVTDDGRGGARLGAGTGLRGLIDRVATVDGTLHIHSPVKGPTVITIDLPLHA